MFTLLSSTLFFGRIFLIFYFMYYFLSGIYFLSIVGFVLIIFTLGFALKFPFCVRDFFYGGTAFTIDTVRESREIQLFVGAIRAVNSGDYLKF